MHNIWRKVAGLDQHQREVIGLRVRHKQSGLLPRRLSPADKNLGEGKCGLIM
jgi:hypothetical protein